MRTQLRFLMAILAFACSGLSANASDIYVLSNGFDGNGSSNTDFGRVDSTTVAYTSIASLTGDI